MMNDSENSNHDKVEHDCSSVVDYNSVKSLKSSGGMVSNAIGTRETKDVTRLRRVVLVVIFLSAIIVGVSVFVIILRQEKAKMDQAYDTETKKIFNSLTNGMQGLVGSLDLFSTLVVSHARSSNSKWPFVTIPDFPNHAEKLLANGVGNTLLMTVIVSPEDRLKWEQFALNKSNIVQSALRIMETDRNYYGNVNWNYSIPPMVLNVSDFSPIPYDTT
jgi:hypothetical protein